MLYSQTNKKLSVSLFIPHSLRIANTSAFSSIDFGYQHFLFPFASPGWENSHLPPSTLFHLLSEQIQLQNM